MSGTGGYALPEAFSHFANCRWYWNSAPEACHFTPSDSVVRNRTGKVNAVEIAPNVQLRVLDRSIGPTITNQINRFINLERFDQRPNRAYPLNAYTY